MKSDLLSAFRDRPVQMNAAVILPEKYNERQDARFPALYIIPGFGGTQRLPRNIGIGRAMEILLTGDPISAAQAAEWGLVNRVVEADQLMEAALTIAKKAASKGPLATQYIQTAVYEGIEKSLAQGLRQEAKEFGEVFKTEDKDEGIKAFIEKRVPEFKGK